MHRIPASRLSVLAPPPTPARLTFTLPRVEQRDPPTEYYVEAFTPDDLTILGKTNEMCSDTGIIHGSCIL